MERPRNRRCSERQHIGVELELLEPLLVLHAKAMLFVDDDEAEVVKLHVLAEKAVSSDHDVDLSAGEIGNHFLLLLRSLEAAHRADLDRKISETVAECPRVLLGENRRRNENRDLPVGLHGLERGAHRDRGLSVTDVTDEQAIHGPRLLHVALHVGSRCALIGCVFEQKRRLELALPWSIGNVRRSHRNSSAGVQIQQLDGHLLNRCLRSIPLLAPPLSAQRVQAWRRIICGNVRCRPESLDLIDAIERDVETRSPFVFDNRRFDGALANEDLLDSAIDADTVLEMDYVISRRERSERLDRAARGVFPRATYAALTAKDL